MLLINDISLTMQPFLFGRAIMEEETFYTQPDEKFYSQPDDVITQLYKTHSLEDASAKVREQLDQLDNITLNIAVTGMTGTGKSTFVNALRGLGSDDPGAAPTGVTETTMTNSMYPHPTMINVRIWDLPGIGSPKFKAKKYLREVKLDTFDFFIILTADRFKENDIMLAKAIRKKNKLFYFVRTKIDNDIRTQQHRAHFNEQVILKTIREDCEQNLRVVGGPKVFLISSLNLDKYDFQQLVATLEYELPENKRLALIHSIPLCSLEVLERKMQYFNKMIWLSAFAAGAAGVTFTLCPLPGATVGCDLGILLAFFQKVYQSFGLDDLSLYRLADRVNKPVERLKLAKKSRFASGVNPTVVMEYFEKPLLKAAMATVSVLNALWIAGFLPAGGISVAAVHCVLKKGLAEIEEDAVRVLQASDLVQCEGMSETHLKVVTKEN